MYTCKCHELGQHVAFPLATKPALVLAGLLPKAFNKSDKGTRAAPAELNNQNQKDSLLVQSGFDRCAVFVDLGKAGHPGTGWSIAFEHPFLENSRAHFPWRAFWLPGVSASLPWSRYVVFRRDECTGTLDT
jgi:hypothetical protein